MNVPDNIFENRIIQMTPHLQELGGDSHYPPKMILFYYFLGINLPICLYVYTV